MKISGKDGHVLFGDAATISAATHSSGTVTITTSAAHGFVEGDRIFIKGVGGMTDINGSFKCLADTTGTTIKISKTTSQTYTSGGEARKHIPITDWTMNKTGEEADVSDDTTDVDAEYVPAGKIRRSGTMSGLRYAGHNDPPFHEVLTLVLIENDDLQHEGEAFFTGEDISTNVPGANAIQISRTWRGTGVWTKTDDN